MTLKRLNIGILAHVDAGKTTITEQILFQSGALREIGSVDKGTSATDNLAIERDRGISIRLATAGFEYNGCKINIIDTPGHIDFCAEVEYSLRALDAVVLVVSAAEGVQGHTISLFNAIQEMRIPCVIFINKIDRVAVNIKNVMSDIWVSLTPHAILLQSLEEGVITSKWNRAIQEVAIVEQVIEFHDELLDKYLEGESLSFESLNTALNECIDTSQLYPVLIGSAKNGLGIEALIELIGSRFSQAYVDDNIKFSAVVFKVEHDKTLGKMAYLRIFSGCLRPRDSINNVTRMLDAPEKVAQLKINLKGKFIDIDSIKAGDIGIAIGLSASKVGDVYGEQGTIANMISLATPLLTVQVVPSDSSKIMNLVQAMQQLSDEDPLLDMQWLSDLRELHIKITGMIQVEILQSVLDQRYGLQTLFSEPSIIYKETPATTSYGYERYWMPKPCWAILKLKIEPAKIGSGVQYSSIVSTNDVAAKYQNEIKQSLAKALAQGIKGWQVTDCKITLIEGEDHNVHSRSGDFMIATPMAIMNGLSESGTTLLEPILNFKLSAALEHLGTITSDITKMRGEFNGPEILNDNFTITGKLPASTSLKYPIELASKSAGRAKFSSQLDSYQPCTDEQGQITSYRGINPLDRDKWILQARGAL
jgi:ribosomal protection tetracycline resistance protein